MTGLFFNNNILEIGYKSSENNNLLHHAFRQLLNIASKVNKK